MKDAIRLWLTTALMVISGAAGAQSVSQQGDANTMTRESMSAATASLRVLTQLVTDENYAAMGFASKGEAASARLGEPLPVYMIQLDELRSYGPGQDIAAMLKRLDQVVYPVLSGDNVRSAVVVEKRKSGWQAVSFGAPNYAKAVARARAAATDAAAGSHSVVSVAALRTTFVSYRRADGTLMFIPIVDNPELKLAIDRPLSAEQALTALVPEAKRYNGLPL